MIDPDQLDHVDRKVINDVATFGWSDIAVFPTSHDQGVPFNYTVGLSLLGHPELIIMGIASEQMHGVLTAAYQAISDGTVFEPNTYSDQILVGYRVAFVEVDDMGGDDFPLAMAIRLYHADRALQIIWPDQEGRFPWEPEFNQELIDRQKLLGPWMEQL